jgi:predicted PurR-regulated permease PerM
MRIRTFENRAFLVVVTLVTLGFFWMLRPFMLPVFWAVVLAVLFRGVYKGYLQTLRGRWRNTSAALTVLTAVLVLIIPLVLIGRAVMAEVIALTRGLQLGAVDVQAPLVWIEAQFPTLADQLERVGIAPDRVREWATEAATTVSQYLAGQALAIGQNVVEFSAFFGIMLYVLFFFVRDGDRIVNMLIDALPLGDARERRLFDRFILVARATVKGTLIVAAVQGALGGLLFWIVGLPAPVLWGVVMTVLSLLPVIGTVLIWGPGAIYLFSVGDVTGGVIVLVGGTFVVGLVDNVLRPLLVARDTQMPDYLVLLATLGGLAKFGLSGFVLGPMLAAFFLVVWEMFAEEFGPLDAPEAPALAEPDPDVPGPGDVQEAAREEAEVEAEAKVAAQAEAAADPDL